MRKNLKTKEIKDKLKIFASFHSKLTEKEEEFERKYERALQDFNNRDLQVQVVQQ